MRLTTKGRFAVTAMIDLALREQAFGASVSDPVPAPGPGVAGPLSGSPLKRN